MYKVAVLKDTGGHYFRVRSPGRDMEISDNETTIEFESVATKKELDRLVDTFRKKYNIKS